MAYEVTENIYFFLLTSDKNQVTDIGRTKWLEVKYIYIYYVNPLSLTGKDLTLDLNESSRRYILSETQ